MAEARNTVGAPTHGLGQTVSFAFQPGNNRPIFEIPKPEEMRTGVHGGVTNRGFGQMAEVEESPLITPVLKWLDKESASQVQRRQAEQFAEGMRKASEGRSIQQIVDEQPWYSRIFGNADLVEGARQWNAADHAAQIAVEIEAERDMAKTLTGEAARDYFTKKFMSRMTGDVVADAALMQQLTKQLPRLMADRAKANYQWMQEEAAAAQQRAIGSAASAFHRATLRLMTEGGDWEEWVAHRDQLMRDTAPLEGQNFQVWESGMVSNFRAMGERGELHALNAYEDQGLVAAMSPDSQVAFYAARAKAEQRAREQALENPDTRIELGQLYADARRPPEDPENPGHYITTEQLLDRVDEINERFRRATGSGAPLIDYDREVALTTTLSNALMQANAARASAAAEASRSATTAAERAIAEAEERRLYIEQAYTGNLSPNMGTESQRAQAVVDAASLAKSPEEVARIYGRAAATLGTVPSLWTTQHSLRAKAAIKGSLEAGGPTPEFDAAYAEFKRLKSDEYGQFEYRKFYSGDLADRFDKYDKLLSLDPAMATVAYHAAFVEPLELDVRRGTKAFEAMIARVDGETSPLLSWIPGVSGLRDDALYTYAEAMAAGANTTDGIIDDEGLAKAQYAQVHNKTVGHSGEFAWKQNPNRPGFLQVIVNQSDVHGVSDPEIINPIINELIYEAMDLSGIDRDQSVTIVQSGIGSGVRLGDAQHEDRLVIVTKDGQYNIAEVSVSDVTARLDEWTALKKGESWAVERDQERQRRRARRNIVERGPRDGRDRVFPDFTFPTQ